MSKLFKTGGGALFGGVLAGIGASACCAGPLVVVSLGFGGAWVSQLTALEPLRPLFIVLALAFFLLGFVRLYPRQAACRPDQSCAPIEVRARQRLLFWAALLISAAIIAFPWYAPLFY